MPSCNEVPFAQISDLIDNELDEEAEHALARHLGRCSDCTTVLSTLVETIRLYQVYGNTAPVPAAVLRRLHACLSWPSLLKESATSSSAGHRQ